MGGQGSLLDIALDHLTSGRAALYAALLTRSCGFQPPGEDERREDAAAPWETARRELDDAVTGLRRAGQQHYLPCGLLARAWLRFLEGKPTGSESAQSDLDEAWETAERGPMRLFLADIHLHRARLFFREAVYPWNKHPDGTPRGPQDDLVAAEKLIQHETTCENPDGTIAKAHYGRRDEELADAKRAILGS
jgi:hypothetical protein